ncbi:MAG: AraC family transcriptional regulator [Roseburia sp.]|nr:AraC family transcriptional regulator [Roseburia sp.]MCM1097209.1 AraC family transcriptional regulator [Ruminococcus flavefaciens]
MLIDNTVIYEGGYKIEINKPENSFFYFFDWDERSYTINMEFQHFHSFYELCIFLDEHAGHLIDGAWHDLRCCDIVAIRPALLHKTSYPEGAPNKRLIINFSIPPMPAGLEGCMKSIYGIFREKIPVFRFEGRYKKEIFEKLNEIYYLSRTPNELTNLAVHQKFIEFLGLIYQYRDKNVYMDKEEPGSIENKIYSITAYIHSRYTEDLSLALLSKEFYISSYYLSHQFKRVTGFTLTDYISMTRVRNAQTLLLSTDIPITEIALQSGFKSFSQFNRAFNKFLQMSPSRFRKESGAQGFFGPQEGA